MKTAHLILSDGTVFTGKSFGSDVNQNGEVVFNTGMAGYPQTLTDPSYRGQILVSTYPLQGNYGVPKWDDIDEFGLRTHFESDEIHIRGLVVTDYSQDYHHWEAEKSLGDWLKENNIPAITGIDTRALTKKLREKGVMIGKILIQEEVPTMKDVQNIEDPNDGDLVGEVSTSEVKVYGNGKKKICLVDTGVKNNIIRNLLQFDTTVYRVPYNNLFMDEGFEYDALFLSNGPGDPEKNTVLIEYFYQHIEFLHLYHHSHF